MFNFIVGIIVVIIFCKGVKAIWDERRIIDLFRKKKNKENH